MSSRAWVTLATNDSYGLGALVLAHSLRRAGSLYPSVVLITPSVTDAMRERLRAVFAEVVTVDVLDSRDAAHLALLQRPELGITFTKIHCWNLTQYEKCVFLDADILVVQNCDELFEREELSAAPDVGWPDCFNSGVFVFSPSTETFNRLIAFARERGSFDGGDQGLLNSFFSDWAHGDINKHLPFLYNVTSAAFYSYLPALKHYGQNLKIIHFIGAAKPWLQQFNWESFTVDAPEHLRGFLQLWWDLFVGQVHSQLDISMVEVEETPPVPPPEQPPHDVSPHCHYQPVMDPESEFPWHHPDAQRRAETPVELINFTDIHDPWEIYKGHIPPRSEEASACHSVFERNEAHEELRYYAWDYQSQNKYKSSNEYSMSYNEDYQHSEYYNEEHQNYRRQSHDERSYQQYNESQNYQQHDPRSYECYHEPQSYEQHHELQTHQQSYNVQSYQHNHETQNYNQQYNPESNWQGYQDHRHSPHINHSPDYWHHEYQHESCQNYDQPEHTINNNNPWDPPYYEHQNFQNDSYENNYQNNFDQNPPYTCNQTNSYIEHNDTPKQHHNTHDNYNEYEHHTVNHNCQYVDNYKQYHSQNYNQLSHQLQQISISNENQNIDTVCESQIVPHLKPNNIEDIFGVQIQRKKKRTRQHKTHRIDIGTSPVTMNGDLSDTNSDVSEEIIPRHPYDGFYLRHRAVIDSYGRKICTHEIPPAPPQSPSPPPEQVPNFVNSEGGQSLFSSDAENQNGVAGNLARVVPGASGSQREVLDELTRRQGWEAGNIDYMGADSFENIWAKISQTLSQPRTSPAKSPPREISPPQPTSVEIASAEVVPETAPEPVEVAKEATEVPVPEATTPVEVPAVIDAAAPVEVAVPVVEDAQVKDAAPVETSVSVEAPAPVKVAAPVETPAPAESLASTEVSAPSEVPTPVVAPTQNAAAPIESAAPVESTTSVESAALVGCPAPVASSVPVESAKPTESAVPVEVVAPADTVTPTAKKVATVEAAAPTEKPAVDASQPPAEEVIDNVPVTVEAAAPPVSEVAESVSAEVTVPSDVPVTVEGAEQSQTIPTTEPTVPVSVEPPQKTDSGAPVEVTPAAIEPSIVAPSDIPVSVEAAAEVPIPVETVQDTKITEVVETSSVQPEAPKTVAPVETSPLSPAVAADVPVQAVETTPPKEVSAPASDSPPLAHTPSKEEAQAVPAAKSEERRKPAGKLQLSPPAAPDPLPTPDSEAEDAAALAHSIITSELQAAAKADPAAAPSPVTPVDRLTVEEPEVPTPPVGAVSLAQIGVKPAKGKPTIAAQIESSVAEKGDATAETPAPTEAAKAEAPKEASKEAPKEAPKKKVVKKVVKKDSGASGAGGDAPVPPPRKKEKKPKEK